MRIDRSTSVVVTGASKGIGKATVEAFAKRGCAIGLLARPSTELDALSGALPDAIALEADVGMRDQVQSAVNRFLGQAGHLDVLVANAGIANYAPAAKLPIEKVERMIGVNYLGTVYAVEAVLPAMLEEGKGQIVIVSSAAAHRAFPSAGAYGASKAAQRAYAEALRHDLDGSGVSVTTIYPGGIKTHLHEHEAETMPKWYARGPRPLDPAVVGEAIVRAVERDSRSVFLPRVTRLMAAIHGLSPALSDRIVRLALGREAAPRRR